MSEKSGEKQQADVTIKVTRKTRQNIARLAAELDVLKHEAVDWAVTRALEGILKEKERPGGR